MASGTFRTTFADFANELATLDYPEGFEGVEGIKLYAHLISITREENTIALKSHRQAFNDFLDDNFDVINSPTRDMSLKGVIKYPKGKAVINVEAIWNFLSNDLDGKSSLLQHLVVISYFSSPKRRFQDVESKLEEISKVFETVKVEVPERDSGASKKPDFDKMFDRDDEVDDFIRNTIGKLFKKGMNTSNPMQTVTNLMKNPMALKSLLQGKSNVSMKKVVMRLADVMPE